MRQPIILGITGASGACYGMRLLQYLLQNDWSVQLLFSEVARIVIKTETGITLPGRTSAIQRLLVKRYESSPKQLQVLGKNEWFTSVASGSQYSKGMVICPCTVGTLSAIANGNSDSLLERAADVIIKEKRKLILVVRETPLSPIHLENMLKLSRIGVVILPASPGFYHHPNTINDLIDFIVARVLDHLGVSHNLMKQLVTEI